MKIELTNEQMLVFTKEKVFLEQVIDIIDIDKINALDAYNRIELLSNVNKNNDVIERYNMINCGTFIINKFTYELMLRISLISEQIVNIINIKNENSELEDNKIVAIKTILSIIEPYRKDLQHTKKLDEEYMRHLESLKISLDIKKTEEIME